MIQPTNTDDYGLSWYSFRSGAPKIGTVILCGNTGPTVDGMPCVYLGAQQDSNGEWMHKIRSGGGREILVAGFRLGERR